MSNYRIKERPNIINHKMSIAHFFKALFYKGKPTSPDKVQLIKPVKKVNKATKVDGSLVVEWNNGAVTYYTGSGTVWRKLPYHERCDTFLEGKLSEIDKYIKTWGNPYPTAHENHPDYIKLTKKTP